MNKNKNAYDGKIAGLYDLEDTLGRGHFACVKLARHVFTGEKVAVKVIDKTKLDEVSRNHLFQEVRCMKLVQHPNVVRLYEVIDTQTKLYLILELGDGGDMYDYIMKHEKGLDEDTAKKYFRQIVHAISYCHRLHVVHRDLKPENVVFFEKLGMVKLTDFGFSNRFCPGQKLETSCGSLAYSAPEILLGDLYDAPAVDVWSLGVILFMLVCGQAPFQEANDSETLTMIMDCKYTIPSHVSAECTRLIGKMLIRDPEKRASLEEIATDPWLESSTNVQYADYLPLVSREHLSEEDHTHIIQKMVTGNIAVQEEILSALDKNAYNHITATYFLLAERKLRALRQERAKLLNASHVSDLSALAISPRNPTNPACPPVEPSLPRTVDGLLSPQETRRGLASPSTIPTMLESLQSLRKRSGKQACTRFVPSILDNEMIVPTPGSPPDGGAPKQRNFEDPKNDTIKSLDLRKKKRLSANLERHVTIVANERIEADEDGVAVVPGSKELSPSSSTSTKLSKFKPITSPNNRKLHSVRSSPQLTLNEIYEEVESDGDANIASKFLASCISNSTSSSPASRVLKTHQSVTSPVIQRKYEQRRRYTKARTASCSSSDASDDDTDQRKRKAEKLRRMPGWRDGRNKDDDDNGGDQGNNGTGPQGGSDAAGSNITGSTSGDTPHGATPPRNPPTTGGNQRCDLPDKEPSLDSTAVVSSCRGIATTGSSSSPDIPLTIEGEVEERHPVSCVNTVLVNSHLRKAEELRHKWGASPSASESSSPIYSHSRSPASIARSMADSASPPPSPLGTPNITSLRQSKTLNQLNRFISSPTAALLGSPLDLGGKENGGGGLGQHCSGPLNLLNLRRPGKWRPPSYPVTTSSASMIAATPDITTNGDAPRTNQYKHSLYRLLKHTPHLGPKRWDINRNGLNGAAANGVSCSSDRASQYSVGLRVGSASPTASSHSKCCSLC